MEVTTFGVNVVGGGEQSETEYQTRKWHGCTPGYLGPYPYPHPAKTCTRYGGYGFSDGCGQVRPSETVPVPTVGIPMGYEQGASTDEGDDNDIARKGNRVVVVTIVVVLLGMRVRVIGREDEGKGDDDNKVVVRGQQLLLPCCWTLEDEGEGGGEGRVRARTRVAMTTTLSHKGNSVIVIVVIMLSDARGRR